MIAGQTPRVVDQPREATHWTLKRTLPIAITLLAWQTGHSGLGHIA